MAKTRPETPKFLKNEKTIPDIYPRNKCAKFQPNPTIFEVSRLPQSIWDTHTDTDTHTGQTSSNFELRRLFVFFYSKKTSSTSLSSSSEEEEKEIEDEGIEYEKNVDSTI